MLTYTIFGIKAYKLAIDAGAIILLFWGSEVTRDHSGSHHAGGSQMCSAR